MSLDIMSLVWKNFQRGGSEKLIMLVLADRSNDKGNSIYESVATMAKKVCLSEKQTRRILHELIDDGYLEVVANHYGGDPGKTRHYDINIEKLSTPPVDVTPPMGVTPPAEGMSPLPPKGGYPSHGREPILKPLKPLKDKRLSPTAPSAPETKEKLSFENIPSELAGSFSREVVNAFIAHRKALRKPLTPHALNLNLREAIESWRRGVAETPDDAINQTILAGWLSVNHEYLKNRLDRGQKNEASRKPRKPSPDNFSARDYGQGIQDL